MKAKHAKILNAIFATPTRASIVFSEIEALLIALGAELIEREGSRVKLILRGAEWHAHRPHPGKEAKKYQVEQVREFLTKLEIMP
ncbi:MAG: type II toxin-antitoxin system HicA family toxin [Methylococcaceae bacterium]|nr:type II toxin-antitoxin system HicA family toxin [Methylococcaceae bacterium]